MKTNSNFIHEVRILEIKIANKKSNTKMTTVARATCKHTYPVRSDCEGLSVSRPLTAMLPNPLLSALSDPDDITPGTTDDNDNGVEMKFADKPFANDIP